MSGQTWSDVYARLGITPSDVRFCRVIALNRAAPEEPPSLSIAALTILENAPGRFRRGTRYSVRELSQYVHYSPSQTHNGLIELWRAGYVDATVIGPSGRKGYRGNPAKLLDFPTARAKKRTV